jgi:hypothetical protein
MVPPLAWIFGKLHERIIYGDGVLEAIATGIMTSLGVRPLPLSPE